VHRFVRPFLTSPDGAFYVSQDADVISGRHSAFFFSLGDEKRRAIGIPRIYKHLYARGNRRRFHACRGRALGALGHHSSQSRWRRLCAPDQTSDLACRRKVGAFVITIRK
jgi:hypothetical protein